MLLTVNGARATRELAELVKAMMDWCAGHDFLDGDVDEVLSQVAVRFHLTIPDTQRAQVYSALAQASPADAGTGRDPVTQVAAFVAGRLPNEPQVLYTLLMAAWMDLCAQAEAEATRENEERERGELDPLAAALGRLTLTGRYYVVSHSGRGKPLLSEAVIGLGLAAGAVAELVIAGQVAVETHTHRLTPGKPVEPAAPAVAPGANETAAPPIPGRVARSLLEDLLEHPAPLRDQLVALAADIEQQVRAELLESGLISPQTHGMLRGRVYYAPTSQGLPKAIRTLVGAALYANPITPAEAVLAELAIATGLDAKGAGDWGRLGSMNRGDAVSRTGAAETVPQLKLLIDLTAAEVDAVVTSPGL